MTWPTRKPRRKKAIARDPVTRRILQPSEHVIQVRLLNALKLLAAPGVIAFAVPNAAKRSVQMAIKMQAEGLLPGVADLCIMMPGGRVGWLELKKTQPRGKLSPAQRAFGETCKSLGHPWACAWSVQEALVYLRAWGALREGVTDLMEAAE